LHAPEPATVGGGVWLAIGEPGSMTEDERVRIINERIRLNNKESIRIHINRIRAN
jgi:hypothetical protein